MTSEKSKNTIRVNDLSIGYHSPRGEPGFSREGINFSASRGEMVALIGPNGAGKSTLLRVMAGFLKQWAGEVLLNGKSVSLFSPGELSRTVSFVSTEPVQVANMSVYELTAYGRFPYTGWLGKLQPADKKIVMESLEKTGLTRFAYRQVSQLSDGERQRALICRAVAQDTPVILLDEPTSFLDISGKYEIFHVLHQLARQYDKTILLSTHDLNIALREMDKFWLMLESGSLEGAPEDAVLNGWLSRIFSGPQIGFDQSAGDFFFQKQTAGTASVTGEGDLALWTIRALERKGFSITLNEEADVTIRIVPLENTGKRKWHLVSEKKTGEFNSIHDLLNGL